MKTFWATLAAGLILTSALIFRLDPVSHFGRAPYRFDKNWADSQLLVYPFDPNERALRAAHLKVVEKPDILLLGSSKMMSVGSAMFKPGVRAFNWGVPGAIAKDYAAAWQTLVEAGKTPARLIIYADPWIFNKNSGQFRWRVNREVLERFLLKTGGGPAARFLMRASSLRERLQGIDTGFKELLNGPVLLAALRDIARGRVRRAGPRIVREGEKLAGRAGWRPDGSVYFGWSEHPLSEIRKRALRFAGETEVFALGRYELDSAEVAALDALLTDASRAGAEVMLIVPPYHKVVVEKLSERPQYRGLIEDFVGRLKSLPGSGERFSLCEAQDPEASGCSEVEFEDGSHPLESCHEKILRRCLAIGVWKGLLPPPAARNPRMAVKAPSHVPPPIREAPRRSNRSSEASGGAAPARPAPQIDWVLIRGGRYMMGAPDLGAEPVHPVMIKTFEMAKSLATVGQYRACVSAGACTAPGTGKDCNWGRSGRERHPINCVDWMQAKAFSAWVGGRLPSEAEWEYAARSRGKYQMYPWGEDEPSCERAMMAGGGDGCIRDTTAPVCSKPKGNSEQGLCDMAGNVWEWVQDPYHFSYEGAPDDGSSWEDPPHRQRVYRGGSSLCATENVRVDVRRAYMTYEKDYRLGFRPVREAP